MVGGDEYWIVFIEYPTAVVNSSELLQPAIITEKPGSGDCIDDHVEHRVHQEGLEVHPGDAKEGAEGDLSAIAPDTREVLRAQSERW